MDEENGWRKEMGSVEKKNESGGVKREILFVKRI